MHTVTQSNTEITQRIITQCDVETTDYSIRPGQITTVRADALWDTGATRSVIIPEVARQLNLKPTGNSLINTANGQVNMYLYKVNLILENDLKFNNVIVAETQLPSTQVLIGMDVISKGDMALTNGNQKTTFSFQIPATRNIDFKEDEEKVNNARQRKELLIISNATMRKTHNRNIVQGKKTLDICNG
jgi:predicted aspartyl protease